MKILQIHNKYQQQGGEDIVYNGEKELLESYGHTVIRYERNNKEIKEYSLIKKDRWWRYQRWQKDQKDTIGRETNCGLEGKKKITF